MEEDGPRGDMTIQSGLSNSTESIDSMKALTAAIEAANAQVSAFLLFNDAVLLLCKVNVCFETSCNSEYLFVSCLHSVHVQIHGPASQHVSNSTMTVSTPTPSILTRGPFLEDHRDEYRKEAVRKGKCLSIGIQVFMKQVWRSREKFWSLITNLYICAFA